MLGYRTTHALQLGNVSDHPIYNMIFATDVDAGHSIMQDVYDHALMHEIPQMRAHAVGLRRSKRELEKGTPRLFELEDDPAPSKNYEHAEPWQPPERLSTPVELDVEPPDEEAEPEEPSDPSDGE